MMGKRRLKITVRRDPEGGSAWLVDVVGTPGAHTFASSLVAARRNGLDMAALWFDCEPDQLEIDWDVCLGDLAPTLQEARDATSRATPDWAERNRAVRALTDAGMTYRDVAELLGISFQRVGQIVRPS